MSQFQRRLKPSESLALPIKVFKVFGFWYIGGKYQPLYFIYGKFIYLIITFYVTCQILSIFDSLGNLREIVDGIYLSLTTFCLLFKLGFINTKKLINILNYQNSEIFTSQQKNQDRYILDAMKSAKHNAVGLLILSTVVCTLWNVSPLLNGDFKKKILPFKAWYPIPQDVSPYYEIAYAFQYLGVLLCAWVDLASNSFMTGSMALTCGQLNVLKHSLRVLRNKAIANFDEIKYFDEKICEFCDNNEKLLWKCAGPTHLALNDKTLDKEICKELQYCIAHHCAILEFIKQYNDTFTKSLFSQFTTSLISICITAFEISIVPPLSIQFFGMLLYLLNITSQIFFYCWYGNEIYLTSLTLNDDIYVSDWYRCGPRVKKIILIMMERFKRPINMKAAKFYNFSLETFTAIIRSTYSFYALLQQMDITIDEVTPEEN